MDAFSNITIDRDELHRLDHVFASIAVLYNNPDMAYVLRETTHCVNIDIKQSISDDPYASGISSIIDIIKSEIEKLPLEDIDELDSIMLKRNQEKMKINHSIYIRVKSDNIEIYPTYTTNWLNDDV